MSLTALGDVGAVIFITIMMEVYQWQWETCLIVSVLFFIAISVTMYLGTEEIKKKKEDHEG